jgi:hypothetical protein
MYISIFRTLYKNVTDNERIERLLMRNNISFEKTLNERGSRYKIAYDNEETLTTFRKNLRTMYPQICL